MRGDPSTAQHRHTDWGVLRLQGIFNTLDKAGQLVEQTIEQLYSEAAGKFLADRFVTGTCPKCKFEVKMLPLLFSLTAFALFPTCLHSSSYLPNSACTWLVVPFLLTVLPVWSTQVVVVLFLLTLLPPLSYWPQVPVQAEHVPAYFLVVLELCCLFFFIHSLPTPLTYFIHSSSWSSS